jgi:4-hydroxybenzoyl-CoA thioesterase
MSIRVSARIYLEDTDAGGIVYHASYLRFMERARTEALRAAGMEQSNTFQSDLSFVLHSMNVRFHTPAHLDDEVVTSCVLSGVKGASLTFEQKVTNAVTQTDHCSAEVVVACIKLSSKRPCRVPPALSGKLVEVAGAPGAA